jgi:D-ribose pyranase
VKAGVLIHPGLLEMLASLGHTDEILICDAGFPIPPQVRTIDFAYRPGHAPFLDLVTVVAATIHVQGTVVASEARGEVVAAIDEILGFPAEQIPHEAFKQRTRQCRGVVRTGEYTPYANVIMTVGVAFG